MAACVDIVVMVTFHAASCESYEPLVMNPDERSISCISSHSYPDMEKVTLNFSVRSLIMKDERLETTNNSFPYLFLSDENVSIDDVFKLSVTIIESILHTSFTVDYFDSTSNRKEPAFGIDLLGVDNDNEKKG